MNNNNTDVYFTVLNLVRIETLLALSFNMECTVVTKECGCIRRRFGRKSGK